MRTDIYTYFPSNGGGFDRVWVKSVDHRIPRYQNCIDDAVNYHRQFGRVDAVEVAG